MSLETPSKIRTLQRKLYRKAKDEHVPTRGTHALSAAVIFGPLGVLQLRQVHLGPRP